MVWLVVGAIVLGFGIVWAINQDRATRRALQDRKSERRED